MSAHLRAAWAARIEADAGKPYDRMEYVDDPMSKYHVLVAKQGDDHIGRLMWHKGTGEIHALDVQPEHKRKGVATDLWHHAQGLSITPKPQHSPKRTDAGDAWSRSIGGDVPERNQWRPEASRTAASQWHRTTFGFGKGYISHDEGHIVIPGRPGAGVVVMKKADPSKVEHADEDDYGYIGGDLAWKHPNGHHYVHVGDEPTVADAKYLYGPGGQHHTP